jgi:hypothetical protein
MGLTYLIVLVCCSFIGSSTLKALGSSTIDEIVPYALWEAAVIGIPIITLSLIREPIGFMSLSLPGGAQGIIELFSASNADGANFLPIKIIASSSGALMLLGYIAALFIAIKHRYGGRL